MPERYQRRIPKSPFLALARNQGGSFIIESTIAVLVFGLIGAAVLVGVSTIHISGNTTEAQAIAENVARNQMEEVFPQPYQAPPAAYQSVATPLGYSVTAHAEEYVLDETNIEKVVVIVSREGQELLTLETLRSNY